MSEGAPLRILAYKPRPARQTIAMERVVCCEPLELEYLAAYLAEHELTLLDGMTDRRDVVEVAVRVQAQLVLFSSFITNIEDVLAWAGRLKRLPDPPQVFVGGVHAEVVPEPFCSPDVDGVFFANQLEGIAAVARRIQRGEPFDDVAGAVFRVIESDGGAPTWKKNPGPPLDPAALRRPRRLLFEKNPDRYFYLHHQRCASIKTAFGCNEKCNFCFCTEMHGGRLGLRPIDDVVDEIAAIQARNILVVDDNFLFSAARLRDFCQLVRARRLEKSLIVYGTASFVAQNPDLMAELRDAGLRGLIVGLETIDDTELAGMNKRARVADNEATIDICNKLDLELFALFMVNPDWTPGQFRALARYLRQRRLAFATFSTWTTFPGTALSSNRASPVGDFQGSSGAPAAVGPGGPDGIHPASRAREPQWWRYDLLRLHQRPRHLSPLRYYLWLLYLYLLPSLLPSTGAELRRRMGFFRMLRFAGHAVAIGVGFLYKLLRWR
ncbi:MAG: cobalamin-dependent protein [Deltaproteobacteria bacterium]|nr:cobalamin-dependent protein [Deltaproteobacteria bacterium]